MPAHDQKTAQRHDLPSTSLRGFATTRKASILAAEPVISSQRGWGFFSLVNSTLTLMKCLLLVNAFFYLETSIKLERLHSPYDKG